MSTEPENATLRAVRTFRDEMQRDSRLMQAQFNVMAANLRRIDDFQRDMLAELHAMYDSNNAMLAEMRAINGKLDTINELRDRVGALEAKGATP